VTLLRCCACPRVCVGRVVVSGFELMVILLCSIADVVLPTLASVGYGLELFVCAGLCLCMVRPIGTVWNDDGLNCGEF
jgi:hypothetical protein